MPHREVMEKSPDAPNGNVKYQMRDGVKNVPSLGYAMPFARTRFGRRLRALEETLERFSRLELVKGNYEREIENQEEERTLDRALSIEEDIRILALTRENREEADLVFASRRKLKPWKRN